MPSLVKAITALDEKLVVELINHHLANGIPPLDIVEECRDGMMAVGDLYSQGTYFLGDLVLAAEIFKGIIKTLSLVPSDYNSAKPLGKIVFGTVEGDIHDIGKNIAISLMQCHGFEVIDLGVDVPSGKFVKSLEESGSQILCLSILLNTCYAALHHTVQEIRRQYGNNIKVLIGGLVSEKLCEYVGADAWVTDARHGVSKCLLWNG